MVGLKAPYVTRKLSFRQNKNASDEQPYGLDKSDSYCETHTRCFQRYLSGAEDSQLRSPATIKRSIEHMHISMYRKSVFRYINRSIFRYAKISMYRYPTRTRVTIGVRTCVPDSTFLPKYSIRPLLDEQSRILGVERKLRNYRIHTRFFNNIRKILS